MINKGIDKIVRFIGEPIYAGRRWRIFIGLLVLTVAADFFIAREHTEYFWQSLPGWSAFFGFISCTLIIFVSKFLGHGWGSGGGLMKREDYYDD